MGKIDYNNWINGDCCECDDKCIEPTGGCDCDELLLEISKLHTDDEVLQEQIDELSGCCSGGTVDAYTKEESDARYQPKGNYLTKESGDTIYQPIGNYLTKASGDTIYQPIGNYLTEHQPLKTINGQVISGTGNITIEGGSVTVDSALSTTSENPVQNKVITNKINEKLDITAYTAPVQSDWNATSGLAAILNKPTIPTVPSVVSAFINDMGYLTEHQSLSGYVTNSTLIQYISNLQQQIDSLKESVSGCCGETGETYTRWVTMTGENDYWCSGTTKMSKEKEQTSTDNVNWTDTGNVRNGSTVLEENCEDCGYVPPTPPSSYKVSLRYIDGTEDNRNCDGNTELKWINPSNWENISGATVGDCITSLGDLCFNGFSGLTSVSIPDTVTKFGGSVFNHCIALPSITIPSGVTSIGNMAFTYCFSLTDITIPNGVETLKYATLYYCSAMTSVTLSNSLRIIDNDAIKDCRSLQTLTLPSTLTSIGKHAFAFGTSLTTVTCLATTPPAFHDSGETGTGGNSGDIFYGCHNLTAIYVPSGSVQAYKNAWPIYESLIQGIA